MEGDNYDVEGIFPEEFRKYVRDQNLFCSLIFNRYNNCWLFRNKHESDEADRYITDELASLVKSYIYVPEQCLVQFWRAQEVIGDFAERRFRLTSRNQPFIFLSCKDKTPFSYGLCSYRMKMVDFITRDGGGGGVIGRVFRSNRAECAPNIGYYSCEEYSDRDLAISCDIKSSLAIPLSDSSGHSIGVIDIVSSEEPEPDPYFFLDNLYYLGYRDCCKDKCEHYDSLKMAVSEIKEVMQLVSRSCLVCAQTWMLCNRCGSLSTCEMSSDFVGGFYQQDYLEYNVWSDLCTLKKGEGVVGKAVTSSLNLVYCDDVSQFSITEYPLAPFARYHKLTACFATCLQSNRTGNQIYVVELFLNPSKVNGRGPRAMLVPILEGMRKNFRTFKFASGEEIGDNLSVQVIDTRFPDKFEILEIGKLDSVENYTFEMELIQNGENVVNTIEEGVAIASLDKQGGKLAVDNPPSARFTWTIEHFSRLNTKKIYSEIFYVAGYKWSLLIFPKGNNVDHLSMYLVVADSTTLPYGWSRYAQFSLAVVNQAHKFTVRKDTQHQFNARVSDWGFRTFMPLSELSGPAKGYIVNDSIIVEADVAIFLQQPVHIDGLAIDNGENMASNIDEQRVAMASLENQHNNATISSIGVINSNISLQPLVEANVVHTEENVTGASDECIIKSSKLPLRNGIDISLEELNEVSGMKRKDAAKRLNVSISTFKRVCRDYQISRWPPRKKNLDQSRYGDSAQIGSTKELGGSAPTAHNESLVTIKAKYGDNFIKFKLSASSGINAFNQQVSKRLELKAGSYVVKYQDDDNDWILVRCDDDMQDYISSSASLGKTTLTMLLEHIE